MKPLIVLFISMLSSLACVAQGPLSKEEIRSELDRYSFQDNRSLLTRIQAAPPLERKQIVDAIVEIAKEEVRGVTLPFLRGGDYNAEMMRSRGTVLNAGYILSEAGEEDAVLEAFSETIRMIEPETRAALAFSLGRCHDPRIVNLIEESAREAVEKLLSFDLSSLNEDQMKVADLYAGSLITSLDGMLMSGNPAGKEKAEAILADFERRSAGRPLMDKIIFSIKDELRIKLSPERNVGETPDSLNGSSAAWQQDQATPKEDESRSAASESVPTVWRVSSNPKAVLVVMIVATLGLLWLLIKKRPW